MHVHAQTHARPLVSGAAAAAAAALQGGAAAGHGPRPELGQCGAAVRGGTAGGQVPVVTGGAAAHTGAAGRQAAMLMVRHHWRRFAL